MRLHTQLFVYAISPQDMLIACFPVLRGALVLTSSTAPLRVRLALPPFISWPNPNDGQTDDDDSAETTCHGGVGGGIVFHPHPRIVYMMIHSPTVTCSEGSPS
ncbi:hypothetical protein Q1695_009770 [Nippostrongylus brasiliensis]|nr:hypothetical protein Q1695_009770 [Nippostrongylus brasiliensis]